ncbi:Elongin-C [Aphelenchoides fujianensis]|nr:Elongin-C [Aphelenchoides fujianensis]
MALTEVKKEVKEEPLDAPLKEQPLEQPKEEQREEPLEAPPATLCGPQSTHVKLVSCDGHEFVVPRPVLDCSPVIQSMLHPPWPMDESEPSEVRCNEIPSPVLHKLVHYFAYQHKHEDTRAEVPDFMVPPEIAHLLLQAANFFDC